MNRSNIGIVIVCLFALPFAGFGLMALSNAAHQILSGGGSGPIWLPLLFGLVFTGFGVGIVAALLYGRKLYQAQQNIQAQFPGQPWKWRSDWALGRVKSNARSNTVSAWVIAALWNLASSPILFLVPHEAPRRGPVVYIGLLFPVIGAFLLIRAVLLSMELREFGKTWFEMASTPGVVGRELKGTIHVHFTHTPDHGIHLQLSCVNRVVTGSGNSRSTWENILWRGESTLSAAQLYTGPAETIIPVSFHIPWEARQTDNSDSRNLILWILEAKADVPGVDYHDTFEVPVFHTAQSPAQPESGDMETPEATAVPPQAPTISVQPTAEGTEFYFPPARNKSFAVSTTAFTAIFGGVTVFLVRVHASLIFPIAFGFFSLLLLYIALQMWMGTTRVIVGGSGLIVQDGWLGGGKRQQIAVAEINSITTRITSQQGGGTGTPYYDIELTRTDGHKVTLGHTVRDKHEAEWLVEEMSRLAGVRQKTSAAHAG